MSNNEKLDVNRFFLWFYRSLGVVGVISVLLSHNMGDVVKFDPFWLRLLVAGLLLGGLGLSFFNDKLFQKIPYPRFWAAVMLTVFWATLNFANDFSRWYFFGYFVTLVGCMIVLYELRPYYFLFGINLAVSLCLIPLLETPEFKLQGYFFSFGAVVFLSFLGLVSGIRKRRDLEENENFLLKINSASFQQSNSAILVTDAKGFAVHFNDLFLKINNLPKAEILGTNVLDNAALVTWLYQDLETPNGASSTLQNDNKAVIEDIVELKDGRFLQRTSRPMFEGERHLGRIWFFNDITELKRDEISLAKARERLARQNQMMIKLADSSAVNDGNLQEVMNKIVDSMSDILEVESASIWLMTEAEDAMECRAIRSRHNHSVKVGAQVLLNDSSAYFAKLDSSRILTGNSIVYPGWQTMDAPIRRRGKVMGIVSAGQPGTASVWEPDTKGFLTSISDLVAVTLEVVERRIAQKELRSTNAIQKAIFDLSGLGILVTSMDRKVISYNDLYLKSWSLDKEFLSEESAEVIIGYCQAQLRNADHVRKSMKFLSENPDQDQFDFLEFHDGRVMERFTSVLVVDGAIVGRVWFFRDITERIETEHRLRSTERRNKAILNALPDLMLRINTAGHILDFKVPENEIFPEINPAIVNKSLRDVFPIKFVNMALEHLIVAQQTGETACFEIEINLTGQERDYEARLVPSNPDELLLIVRDVTERKRAEKELMQRNYELDSFVYRASHDLKAPLNSLMGLIDIVKNETEDGNVLSYLGLMDKSVVKLDTFIRNLTDFSRINRLEIQYEKVDFEQMVKEITESLRYMDKAERVRKTVRLEPGEALYADSFHIGIVLSNLISNAIKYQDLSKEDPYVEVAVNISGKEAMIVVADNGMGIPLEYQDRIFELFFRASNQSFGSGLGLYITRNAVEKMAGKISFESSPENGTRFTVIIPNYLEQATQVLVSDN